MVFAKRLRERIMRGEITCIRDPPWRMLEPYRPTSTT